ncbi:hypothetical protein BABINDRAFT_5370 [Babjeviella inositovora NRRL Y-12698]|uniref:CID domain-containing protein n=1 Tax=Babjeviella inositovora NRRL Y-12698 TaxID=984486 RepID=A0A1E3QZ80_9ASCO|nr:uncharacterized protein BABINDRAFT_5370 [Babjeviella inositovora NRRL Y-12698]ODQ82392.1 hypothetical protein BABINDRAFT_5370 [Babjeviella inositovora NRRL Y-12698]
MPEDLLITDYTQSLEELTFNSAPLIKTLSVIAGESVSLASEIALAVQFRINKCPPTQKLFAFYLLDSICKNVGNPYNILFGTSIYDLFTRNYTLVSDQVRQKLINLFTTWRDTKTATGSPLFPQDQLDRIEEFLLRATRSTTELSKESLIAEIEQLIPLVTKKMAVLPHMMDKLRTQLEGLNDIKKLLASTKLPVKTLAQIKDKLGGFKKEIETPAPGQQPQWHTNGGYPGNPVNGSNNPGQFSAPAPGTRFQAPSGNQLPISNSQVNPPIGNQLPGGQLPANAVMTPEMLKAMYEHFQKLQPQASSITNPNLKVPANIPSNIPNATNTNPMSVPLENPSSMNPGMMAMLSGLVKPPGPSSDRTKDVLAKLFQSGLVNPPKSAPVPPLSVLQSLLAPKSEGNGNPLAGLAGIKLPSLSSNTTPLCTNEAELTQAIDTANPAAFINEPSPYFQNLLYGNRSKKCGTCGKRFSTASNVEMSYYEAHLDWHFRVSKKVLENNGKIIQNRVWFLDDLEWVAFRDREEILEFSVSSNRANSGIMEPLPTQATPEVALPKQTYVVIGSSADTNTTSCYICKEAITGVYNDDIGEWIWPNAVQVKQAGQLRTFHYSCYEETLRNQTLIGMESGKRPAEGVLNEKVKRERLEN